MKQTDILDMLSQEQLDQVEGVFYEFIKDYGYKIKNKFDLEEQKNLKKEMIKNKDSFDRDTFYDYENHKIIMRFSHRKAHSRYVDNHSIKIVLEIPNELSQVDREGLNDVI